MENGKVKACLGGCAELPSIDDCPDQCPNITMVDNTSKPAASSGSTGTPGSIACDLYGGLSVEHAVRKLTDAIKKDEGFYISYQANIAMAFKDEYGRCDEKYKNKKDIHRIANVAAKNFIDLWCMSKQDNG